MAEKILNTRILLKYDTYANWMQNNPVLKVGEMAVATVETNDAQGKPGFQNLPNVVLKVGQKDANGELQRYSALPFVSALAADVHGWAKAADKPTYGYTEITGLEDELARVSAAADTDTQYKLVAIDEENYKFQLQSKEKSETEWKPAGDLDLSGIVSRVKALEDKFVGMEEATVAAHVEAKIAELDFTEVKVGAGEIIEAVSEADGVISVSKRALAPTDFKDDLVPEAAVDGLTEKLAALEEAIGDAEEGSLTDAKAYTDEKIAELDYNGGEDKGAHKFVTVVTQADGVVAATYARPVIDDIEDLTDTLKEINEEIDTKQDILYFTPVDGVDKPNNTDNRVATEKYVINAVADLNGAMHFIGKVDSLPASGEGYNAGDVIMVADAEDPNVMVEYVLDKTGTWQKLGHESIYELKADANGKHEAINKAIEDLGKRHDDELAALELDHTNRLNALDAAYKKAIADLDHAEVKAGDGEIISLVSQADGAITVDKRKLVTADFEADLINQSSIKGLVTKLEEIDQAILDAEGDALQDAKDYSDAKLKEAIEGLDTAKVEFGNGRVLSYIEQADGAVTYEARDLATADFKDNLINQSAIIGLSGALENAAKAGTDAAAQALTDAKAYADKKVEDLDYDDAEVAKNFVTEVKQTDGAIAVKRAPVADIALTGNVNDLVQTTGDVLVFNCGNSAVDTAYEFVK